jgi:hypothetical protein
MKICSVCKIEKPFLEFYKRSTNRDNLDYTCKKCNAFYSKIWRNNNKEKISQQTHTYSTSEIGFLRRKIATMYAPSMIKKTQFKPTCTKKEFEKSFYEYVKKHGRNCFYCKEPWTYNAKFFNVGNGRTSQKGETRLNLKNLSFDRLDTSKTYSIDNNIFCCQQCNLSKKDVSISLIKRLHEIITERNL